MNYRFLGLTNKGFTLIEIMVVVGIISVLAAVVAVNAIESGKLSRDAKRQSDLRALQSAIELYKNKEGRYPAGCNGFTSNTAGSPTVWSGQLGSDYQCAGGNTQYIVGLAPEYISVLPQDRKLNGNNSGYVYTTNQDGTVYKVMAMNTVESESLNTVADYLHPFKSCDMRATINSDGSAAFQSDSWCNSTAKNIGNGNNAVVPQCRSDNSRFQQSYGVWGGFASCLNTPCAGGSGQGADTVEAWTEIIICR